jgi:hypothetical protein
LARWLTSNSLPSLINISFSPPAVKRQILPISEEKRGKIGPAPGLPAAIFFGDGFHSKGAPGRGEAHSFDGSVRIPAAETFCNLAGCLSSWARNDSTAGDSGL